MRVEILYWHKIGGSIVSQIDKKWTENDTIINTFSFCEFLCIRCSFNCVLISNCLLVIVDSVRLSEWRMLIKLWIHWNVNKIKVTLSNGYYPCKTHTQLITPYTQVGVSIKVPFLIVLSNFSTIILMQNGVFIS